ncbi:MAG: hypothetical protein WAK17_08970 [Candidatus Nitrosopolaris sp.]|jgi:hypothetical protein
MTSLQPSKWNDSQPPKNSSCRYSVEFTATPHPSDTLHSMDAGKVQLNVFLKGSYGIQVKDVVASIINQRKTQSLRNLKDISKCYIPEEKNLYSLEISYKLADGKVCTAIFDSADAFHRAV